MENGSRFSVLSETDITQKPDGCKICPYSHIGAGFVPDWVPADPLCAFLFEAAGATEIIEREPVIGGTGKIFTHMCNRLNWSRNQILIANVLRCNPPDNRYPIGSLRKDAERSCSQYLAVGNKNLTPGGLNAFNPDYFLLTLHPAACMRSWPLTRILRSSFPDDDMGDLNKAKKLVESGKRLLVCMGDKAKEFVFPGQFPGGVLRWRSHHGVMNWKDIMERYETKVS